ncbi:MAG: DUF4287 domain-containing protein [Gemmataceae bacterium]|nr:DUF4287 domain-containing protein [Gemmataceae bacterium]
MAKKSLYSLHPIFGMEAGYERALLAKTGRDLAGWVELVKKDGPAGEKERRAWLRETHKLSTNYTWWIAERAEGRGGADTYDPERYVADLFAKKPALVPMYDRLLKLALKLGRDVKACPCQTIVPLYRSRVFAQLKPATRTRLELSFVLGGMPFTERLRDSGGTAKGDRLTHVVALHALEEIDAEVGAWLTAAYERDAEPARKAKRA